jgi:hypothetical protein
MKFKHTAILLVLLAALAAYVYYIDLKKPTTKEREEKKGRLFEFDRDKISAVSIKTPESKVEIRKDGQNWRLEEPVKDRADSSVMSSLLTSVELLRSESTIDNDGKGATKEQLKDFGISDSQTKVKLTVDGKPVEVVFGKETAIPNKVYAMVEGAKSVEVVSNSLRNDISKKVEDFRDKKLSDLTLAQVSKAVIKSPAGEIEVEKANDHWSLVRPLKARGDDAKIGDVISQAITARVESFIADTSKLGEYGLEQPRGTVTFTVEGQAQPQVLSIGGNPKDEKDKEKVYARLSSRDAVVLLPKSVETLLTTKPNDLRDKKLTRFNSDLVDRINIEPAGKDKLVFARDGKNWVRKTDKDVQVNGSMLTKLLDDLAGASVTNFAADVATDLPKYGLDQPAVKVTLSAFSSENTAETKAGEKPIVTLLFGKVEGNDVYAKADDEPFILATPKAILDSIVTDPLQLQPLEIYQNKTDDIASFEVAREGQPTLGFERDKDKNWKLSKGDEKVNTINVQSLVNTLASLRGVRWVGATVPDHGLDKPEVTVSFKTTGNTSGKLLLGKPSPDEMRFASAEGLTGTFLVNRPDYEAFVAALIEKPVTAAAPGGPGTPPVPPSGAAPAVPADASAKPKIEAVTPPVAAPPLPANPPAEAPKPPPTEAPAQPPQKP